jgi:hypothetical protein
VAFITGSTFRVGARLSHGLRQDTLGGPDGRNWNACRHEVLNTVEKTRQWLALVKGGTERSERVPRRRTGCRRRAVRFRRLGHLSLWWSGWQRPFGSARSARMATSTCSAPLACSRRAGGGSRMGRFWTGASTPDLQRGSSGRQRHQPSPPASWRRIQHAFEVPSSAVDRRVAVEVVSSHRQC